jgi:flagellar L-ring protein precursor FlgH
MRLPFALFVVMGLAGCAVDPRDFGHEPHMTPVGTGLQPEVLPYDAYRIPVIAHASPGSLWSDEHARLFQDPRAIKVGDVLTVNISINDKATLGNNSGRSTDAEITNSLNASVGTSSSPTPLTGTMGTSSKSSTNGQGNIDRSEVIQLSIAAVVTQVLPDGNLLISGSQEVRVNFELRLLNVAGIVRPGDISKDNTISYQKIAEARISYGGRGRMSEVQQPAWGQQIYDNLKPF